jgi:chaperonin cofactor prefoldin
MKTINDLRNELANYKKTKKELEKLSENKNLFNRGTILWRIRRINYKIWKTKRILKEYAY